VALKYCRSTDAPRKSNLVLGYTTLRQAGTAAGLDPVTLPPGRAGFPESAKPGEKSIYGRCMAARNRTTAARNRSTGPAQAAAALLQQRVRYIEELERARNAERRARATVEQAKIAAHDAAVRTGEAYRADLDAGWTTSELRQLGFGDKRTSRARRTGRRAAALATTNSINDSASPTAAADPHPMESTGWNEANHTLEQPTSHAVWPSRPSRGDRLGTAGKRHTASVARMSQTPGAQYCTCG
jgi:hypothetical protein